MMGKQRDGIIPLGIGQRGDFLTTHRDPAANCWWLTYTEGGGKVVYEKRFDDQPTHPQIMAVVEQFSMKVEPEPDPMLNATEVLERRREAIRAHAQQWKSSDAWMYDLG